MMMDVQLWSVSLIYDGSANCYNQMQRSRERDFSNTRLSYSRHIAPSAGRPSLSPSRRTTNHRQQRENIAKDGKLCVNCFNHQLSLDKINQKPQDIDPQALTLSTLSRDNARERDLYKNQAIKTNEFNLKKIQENQRKRQEERDRVKDENTSQLRLDHLRDLQERRQLQQKRRNQLRQDLQKQIALAKQRRQQQEEESKNNAPRPIISNKNNEKDRQVVEQLYKQQLLKQINQAKKKRHQQEEQERICRQQNQLKFIVNAENKRRNAQALEQTFKQMTKTELQKKADMQKAKKAAQAQQREQQSQKRLNEEMKERQAAQMTEAQRRQKIERYICELKKQMQENASKRNEEFSRIAKAKDSCFIAPQRQVNVQPCSCCHKETPSRQLAPYIREMKH